MRSMIFEDFWKKDYVVQEHKNRLLFKGRKDSIHGFLRGDGDIAEPEWHFCELEESMLPSERSLLAFLWIDLNFLVARVYVKRQEDGYPHQEVNTLVQKR